MPSFLATSLTRSILAFCAISISDGVFSLNWLPVGIHSDRAAIMAPATGRCCSGQEHSWLEVFKTKRSGHRVPHSDQGSNIDANSAVHMPRSRWAPPGDRKLPVLGEKAQPKKKRN